MTERLRDCAPVPHDFVQAVQAPNALVWQWIGHGPWLHVRVSAECGQAVPPLDGATMVRVRLCEPLPHDLEQTDQTGGNWPMSQLTGHAAVLQARVSAECGQALPPELG